MKLHVLEMQCLRSLVGVSRIDRVSSNEEVRRRAGATNKKEGELSSSVSRVPILVYS